MVIDRSRLLSELQTYDELFFDLFPRMLRVLVLIVLKIFSVPTIAVVARALCPIVAEQSAQTHTLHPMAPRLPKSVREYNPQYFSSLLEKWPCVAFSFMFFCYLELLSCPHPPLSYILYEPTPFYSCKGVAPVEVTSCEPRFVQKKLYIHHIVMKVSINRRLS